MSEGYGKEDYGHSPYGLSGDVIFAPPHPVFGGYGGSEYGHSPYGSMGIGTRPVIPVTGGYGGYPYGHSPYGSIGTGGPFVTAAHSIDGFNIEVFFDREMFIDTALLDPTSYTITDLVGAAPSASVSVTTGVVGTLGGATSIILSHTGTTLGGFYRITVNGPKSLFGSPISGSFPQNQAELLTKGDPPPYTITPFSGDELLFEFAWDMLPESGFTPGIEDFSAYKFTTSYPVPLNIVSITHPFSGDDSKMLMKVNGQTSVGYTCEISPADAIIYDGSILPSASTEFIGIELGIGTSLVNPNGLLLTCGLGDSYGWQFEDLTGKLIPGSSYRLDITFDVSLAALTPALFDTTFGVITVNDGNVEFAITLLRVGGIDTVTVVSGAYTDTFPADWSSGETTVTLARNQKAQIFTTLVNGEPLSSVLTSVPNGPTTFPTGASFLLDPAGVYQIDQLPLKALEITSTQTVFSAAWNFLHGQKEDFIGSDDLTNDTVITTCTPLTKGWGDSTPATIEDVHVFVNGVEVEVESVNPYIGHIITVIPIPLMPPGLITVETDYICFPGGSIPLDQLDCPGLNLDMATAADGYTVLLDPVGDLGDLRPQPLQIGHRFIGYERAYSALNDSPTTLLLDEDPHKSTRTLLQDIPPSDSVSLVFDTFKSPTEATPAWELNGVDAGGFEDSLTALYTVKDASEGSFNIGDVALYSRQLELSFPSSIVISAWFFVDPDTVTYDGVFTGVGFGVHDNFNLYLVGALLINGIQHVGMLKESGLHQNQDAWALAYRESIEILDATTFRITTSDLPELSKAFVDSGDVIQFQIFEGTQSGIYTIVEIINQSDGTSTVTINDINPFPEDPRLWDNRDAFAVFETRWDGTGLTKDLTIYRLVVKSDNILNPEGNAQLFIGSAITGSALDIEGVPKLGNPPDEVLNLPVNDKGSAFFGSLSRQATNESRWAFVRYGVDPDQTRYSAQGVVVSGDMDVLPQDDPDYQWFVSQKFGTTELDSSSKLLLKATSASTEPGVTSSDLSYGIARIEPFLERSINFDVDVKFQVDSGILGAGDLEIEVFDTSRLIRLATILYTEDASRPEKEFRQLLQLPAISLSGLQTPVFQGWEPVDPGFDGPITASVEGQITTFTQVVGTRIRYQENFVEADLQSTGRILEARLQFQDIITLDAQGETNIFIGANVGPITLPRSVALKFRDDIGGNPERVSLFSPSSGAEVVFFDFTWNDGKYHIYRIIVDPDADAVSLVIDDTVIGVATYSDFDAATDNTQVELGFVGDVTTATVLLDSFSITNTPPLNAKRTLGVWLGADETKITSWELPRSDISSDGNNLVAAVIEEMDWRVPIQLRIHRDPTWGVTIIRPDLPPPPYFDGEFATDISQPSAGWINVEYKWLPRDKSAFGGIRYGALNSKAITQQRWESIDYRIYPQNSEDFIPLHHSVLDQFNVITSGEFNSDITVEKYVVQSLTATKVFLRPINVTADRIFNISFDGAEGENIVLTPEFFTFDKATQLIVLNSGLLDEAGLPPSFPETKTPVLVCFAPGKPITKTYLNAQPLEASQTLLNEGTPPIPKSQIGPEIREEVPGSILKDPRNLPGIIPGEIDNTPYSSVEFTGLPKDLYDCMEFCEIDNGGQTGLLSTLCDGPGLGQGWNSTELSGPLFSEQGLGINDGAPNQVGEDCPNCVLELSGGGHLGTELNNCILVTSNTVVVGSQGNIHGGVFGTLLDPVTSEVEILYFGR